METEIPLVEVATGFSRSRRIAIRFAIVDGSPISGNVFKLPVASIPYSSSRTRAGKLIVNVVKSSFHKAFGVCIGAEQKSKQYKATYRSIANTSAFAKSPALNILDPLRPAPVAAFGKSP